MLPTISTDGRVRTEPHRSDRVFELDDYKSGNEPRWCSGCGDLAVLTAVQRLLRDRAISPEKVVFVSGIGCSSRFPHYMGTYGFHGVHGRPIPVATGLVLARPDLHVFVITGDGDCLSIGMSHLTHGLRYNVNLTVLLLDNQIYGLTKKQTSPTTAQGFATYTQPYGSYLPAIQPITIALGATNASYVARAADWIPPHLYDTIAGAFDHPGMGFVQVLQRCPVYNPDAYGTLQNDSNGVIYLQHERGIPVSDGLVRRSAGTLEHDPLNLEEAFALSQHDYPVPLGLFYANPEAPRYDLIRRQEIETARQLNGTPSINSLLAGYEI
ncbi:MAG: thiamine pyrophosphate-dependent enzyme [Anaerolineae bacterium]